MFIYWLLFAYFAIGAMLQVGDARAARASSAFFLGFGALIIALLVGFRFEVGGDWDAYKHMFSFARYADLEQMLKNGDPAYQILNWAVERIGGNIVLVNSVCGALFAWGMFRFACSLPNPWLAMVVAIPYLVVVVAMGYSRQGVAIGLIMAGLAALSRGTSTARFSLYVLGAALFHKTAVFALLIILLRGRRSILLNLIFVVAILGLMYAFILEDSIDSYVDTYIDSKIESQGAAIRVIMNLFPATLFLWSSRRFEMNEDERKLWRNFSLAAFGMLALLLVLPSSTVVDRMSLYILPLQIAILSRVPGRVLAPAPGRFAIFFYSFSIQFVWLNYAAYASHWIPYKFYPL